MTVKTAILLLGAAGAILLALAGWLLIGKRRSPAEQERARRRYLSARGRVADAEITDIEGAMLEYSYEVAGVRYHVTQDIGLFLDLLPPDPALLLGPASIKYAPGNPANSILISEEWTGVRLARPAPLFKQKGA
ncbi:MAG: hypothetical protein HY235_03150 [Acidobacteria bacterium]|nr:hypothetical protein [Acidobacteriota bacterium]